MLLHVHYITVVQFHRKIQKKNRKETESKSSETTKSKSKAANTTKAHQRYVALFDLNFAEKLMCSANILQLPSLLELVELQCSKIICVANVERIATIAERVNAIQLLNAAVSFIVENLYMILSFYGGASSMKDRERAPYRYLRVPLAVRVRVGVLHSCFILPLARDACCDAYTSTSTDKGKRNSDTNSNKSDKKSDSRKKSSRDGDGTDSKQNNHTSSDSKRPPSPSSSSSSSSSSCRVLHSTMMAISGNHLFQHNNTNKHKNDQNNKDTNRNSDGHSDGYSDGHSDGHSNEHSDGHSDEHSDGHVNDTVLIDEMEKRFVQLCNDGVDTLEAACKFGGKAALKLMFPTATMSENQQQMADIMEQALQEADLCFQTCLRYKANTLTESKSHEHYINRFSSSLKRAAEELDLLNPTAKKKHLLKFFPQEQSQIPACTGHKALHVSGNRMLVLGGGNRYSYMSLKNVMTYHTTTGKRRSGTRMEHCSYRHSNFY